MYFVIIKRKRGDTMKKIIFLICLIGLIAGCTGRLRRTYYIDDFEPGDSIIVDAQDGTERELIITIGEE